MTRSEDFDHSYIKQQQPTLHDKFNNFADKFLIKPSTKLKYSEDDGWGHFDVIVNNFLASYEENKGKICSNNNPSEEDNPCDFDVNSLGQGNSTVYYQNQTFLIK